MCLWAPPGMICADILLFGLIHELACHLSIIDVVRFGWWKERRSAGREGWIGSQPTLILFTGLSACVRECVCACCRE